MKLILRVSLLLALAGLSAAARSAAPSANVPEVVYAVGDIADCRTNAHRDVATLIAADRAKLPADTSSHLLLLGDQVYPNGTAAEFADCFDPAWGRFKPDTLAVPGNHDYRTAAGAPFYAYFGAPAAPLGYYAQTLGNWLILGLNSNIDMGPDSAQARWMSEQLAANTRQCVIAMWHHPRYSSGAHGNNAEADALWRTAQRGRVSLVLAGHDHHYERFVPLDASGAASDRGIRSFVVGTGGAGLYPVNPSRPAISAARISQRHGVLRLTLGEGSYQWQFIGLPNAEVLDAGEGQCLAPAKP
ncbi:hypothetical protein GCM10025771_14450 [Niveibacterium umoris]|uniref:Calcineurin-like phosphoesterase domain-containing protein n=1 Tax=Niveibacterium umoris TaxID=1193620 RepID=A0A840BSN1_9RHOO|nr:metallophosphoesterase family protein [Niveibacterium umoris]MBB4014682.1 hypothetical protein [Niveibacterium umoris]